MGMLLRRHYPQKPVETEVVNETEVVTYNDYRGYYKKV